MSANNKKNSSQASQLTQAVQKLQFALHDWENIVDKENQPLQGMMNCENNDKKKSEKDQNQEKTELFAKLSAQLKELSRGPKKMTKEEIECK